MDSGRSCSPCRSGNRRSIPRASSPVRARRPAQSAPPSAASCGSRTSPGISASRMRARTAIRWPRRHRPPRSATEVGNPSRRFAGGQLAPAGRICEPRLDAAPAHRRGDRARARVRPARPACASPTRRSSRRPRASGMRRPRPTTASRSASSSDEVVRAAGLACHIRHLQSVLPEPSRSAAARDPSVARLRSRQRAAISCSTCGEGVRLHGPPCGAARRQQ